MIAGCDRPPLDKPALDPALVAEGWDIFRFDTFGDEGFGLMFCICIGIFGYANGGYGTGVSPAIALAVGLNVDAEALPTSLVTSINEGEVDLDDSG